MNNPIWKPNELTNMDYAKYEKMFDNPEDSKPVFLSVSSISGWAHNRIQYLDGSELLPYVLKGEFYHYFSFCDGQYTLFATSERDIQENKE